MRTDRLVEVWGDTVDIVHLGGAIVIGCLISLAGFLLASSVLTAFVQPVAVARAYAMLVGLGGCLISGVVCAVIYSPKRAVVETAADPFWREEVLAQLVAENGSLGSISNLPEATVLELKELGLYELFASHDKMNAEGLAQAEQDMRRELLHSQPAIQPSGH